jgi:hypothetical protein
MSALRAQSDNLDGSLWWLVGCCTYVLCSLFFPRHSGSGVLCADSPIRGVRAVCKAAAGVGYRVQQLILFGVQTGLTVVSHIFVIGAIYLTWQCGDVTRAVCSTASQCFRINMLKSLTECYHSSQYFLFGGIDPLQRHRTCERVECTCVNYDS